MEQTRDDAAPVGLASWGQRVARPGATVAPPRDAEKLGKALVACLMAADSGAAVVYVTGLQPLLRDAYLRARSLAQAAGFAVEIVPGRYLLRIGTGSVEFANFQMEPRQVLGGRPGPVLLAFDPEALAHPARASDARQDADWLAFDPAAPMPAPDARLVADWLDWRKRLPGVEAFAGGSA